jgi:hypothetical protein
LSKFKVLSEVAKERERQDLKWGEQNWPIKPKDVLFDFVKVAAYAKQVCDSRFDDGTGSWYDILNEEFCEVFAEDAPSKQREELIQVAAVAVAMIECIDRKALKDKGSDAK